MLTDFQKAQKSNKDFAYKEKRLRDEFDGARKDRDTLKLKVAELEEKISGDKAFNASAKMEVSLKNKMINQIRDDAKDLAVAKIKLTKKTAMQEGIMKALKDQMAKMMEQAKNSGQ